MSTKYFFMNRRNFLRVTAAGVVLPAMGAARKLSGNDKLNVALIGCGGKGEENLRGVSSENIVALCDVDDTRAANAYKAFPNAKRYKDFRKMFDAEKSIDAVVVTTPDHLHAQAALTAMKLGMHCYCEKPLTHSVHEARLMRKVAREQKVATQMGNQGHSYNGTRRAVEVIQAGAIGNVTEAHIWTDRPIWPQGIERPKESQTPPPTLDWDLWLGPAPVRPYNEAYVPFKWRGFWDFGTGALGDMACHCADTTFWALDLGSPESVEAEQGGMTRDAAPNWSVIRYQFPKRGKLPPVKLTWYDGGKKPDAALVNAKELPPNGSILIGDKGMILMPDWHADNFVLLPKEKFAGYKDPAPTIRRTDSHYREWIAACKGGPASLSNFDYAALLTETVLLGNVAMRTGQKIEWDAKKGQAKNNKAAEEFLNPPRRKGWELPV